MHIPFMCVCIDIVYHIFLQQRHITHQILDIGAIALRHMHLLLCNAFETIAMQIIKSWSAAANWQRRAMPLEMC